MTNLAGHHPIKAVEQANRDEATQHFTRKQIIAALVIVFVTGSIFGFIYEEIFYFFNDGFHAVHRGSQLGPWLPIYGFGALAMALLLLKFRKNPLIVFLGSGITCGILEYTVGWASLTFLNTRYWDYNVEILNWGNIGGFICARSVLFFAIAGLMLIYVLYPLIREFVLKVSNRTLMLVAYVPATIYLIDIVTAVLRTYILV